MNSEKRGPDLAANWLTVYPSTNKKDRKFLLEFSRLLGNTPDTKEIVLAISEALETRSFKRKQLNNHQIKLLINVFNFITRGVELGVDVAVSLQERMVTDRETVNNQRKRNELRDYYNNWSFYTGDYRGQLVENSTNDLNIDIFNDENYIPNQEPGDCVHFLKKRIEKLLTTKKNLPVVLIDIGAMYGTTLLELASVFEEEILAGKLVLIGTDLILDKKFIEEGPKPSNGNRLYSNYEKLYKSVGHLVHFLVSDVKNLKNNSISLPTGDTLIISPGSVDIVHESWSISAHSRSLERDIINICDLLGDNGVLMSRTSDPIRGGSGIRKGPETNYISPAYFEVSNITKADLYKTKLYEILNTDDDFKMRTIFEETKSAAVGTLENRGYKIIDRIVDPTSGQKKDLSYTFYVGNNAVPLDIYDEKGNKMIVKDNTPERQRKGPLKFIKKIFRKN